MHLKRIGTMAATVLVLLLSLAVAGETGTGPIIRFEKTAHDFGKLPSDSKVAFSWSFRNIGDAPLKITGTRPQCGCTATVQDDTLIPPGGSGSLEITFDPAGLSGSIRKSLAVRTNERSERRTLLEIMATVIPVERKVEEGTHPPTAGQSLLIGSCAGCHAAPAAGRTGADLYAAVCAMCHGDNATGGLAPSLREQDYLASRDDVELHGYITYGSANPKMPGFSALMGGPLSEPQIDSLVELLRTWGPLSSGEK